MIAEINSGFYDIAGHSIVRPSKQRHGAFGVLPIRTFTDRPLKVVCQDIDEIRAFLSGCRYVSDRTQFKVEDHWMPPDQFEQTRRGDCEDFAFWTWRQFLGLGYKARLVAGVEGRGRTGHAWVTFRDGNKTFLVEPQLARLSGKLPRLNTLLYDPILSVEASGSRVQYFEHAARAVEPGLRDLAPLIPEWLLFHLLTAPRAILDRLLTPQPSDVRQGSSPG